MSKLPAFPCTSFLLLCILGMTLVTTGFPQPQLQLGLDDSDEPRRDDYNVLFPSISLRDWSIQMMSASGGFEAPTNRKADLVEEAWLSSPKSQLLENAGTRVEMGKRNMVVADDAAFREKSKLLTAMERQKWLNSYMQKLLVVNSQ